MNEYKIYPDPSEDEYTKEEFEITEEEYDEEEHLAFFRFQELNGQIKG